MALKSLTNDQNKVNQQTSGEVIWKVTLVDSAGSPVGYLQNNIGIAGGTILIGGTGTTDDLTLQTTSGVGATGADMHFLVGNNGATEAITILNNGNVGLGATGPVEKLVVTGNIVSSAAIYATGSFFSGSYGPGSAAGSVVFRNWGGSVNLTCLDNGHIGIGLTGPTAVLHLKAGTATASTAPLKFTTGTLLTTAEAGAVEFLTDSYYATTTTGAIRRMIVTGSTGRLTGQTDAATLATYTLGATDASYEISANIQVTTSTLHNFTVTCVYTDETNTSRTFTFGFAQLSGSTLASSITNVTGAGPYESPVYHIRCKASSVITIATVGGGGFTTVTYNGEGVIKQTA